jgi:hypothetical protein
MFDDERTELNKRISTLEARLKEAEECLREYARLPQYWFAAKEYFAKHGGGKNGL